MTKPDSDHQPRILTVDQHSELERTTLAIPACKDLDDEDILAIMEYLSESQESATTVERVSGQVAHRVRELQIAHGSELVIPVSRVITRSMIPRSNKGVSELSEQLHNKSSREETIHTGIELGDKATNVAAGLINLSPSEKRDLVKLLSVNPFHNLAQKVAKHGYLNAYLTAQQSPSPEALQVTQEVPVLLRRFQDVVKLVSRLF